MNRRYGLLVRMRLDAPYAPIKLGFHRGAAQGPPWQGCMYDMQTPCGALQENIRKQRDGARSGVIRLMCETIMHRWCHVI